MKSRGLVSTQKGSLFHSGDYIIDSSRVVACDCNAGPDMSKYRGFQIPPSNIKDEDDR